MKIDNGLDQVIGILFFVMLFGLPVASVSGQTTPRYVPYKPEVGTLHADFSLPSIDDGKFKSLSEFRGKKLLLFHFASW